MSKQRLPRWTRFWKSKVKQPRPQLSQHLPLPTFSFLYRRTTVSPQKNITFPLNILNCTSELIVHDDQRSLHTIHDIHDATNTMLALASTPSHDHSSAYASTVTAVSAPQPARSKPVARRAASSASLKVTSRIPLTSTSTSIHPPKLVRGGGVLPPRPHSEVEHSSKPPAQHGTQQPKMNEVRHSQEVAQPPAVVEVPSGPPMPLQLDQNFDIDKLPTTDLLRNLAALLTDMACENDAKTSHKPQESRPENTESTIWDSLFTASQAAFSSKSSRMTFHARNIPTIALEAYLLRILRYCPTTNEVFLSLLVYFDRISKLSEEATGSRFVIDSYNVHRLVMAGVTVASKFFSDVFYTNSRYAKVRFFCLSLVEHPLTQMHQVGGLPLAELNQLELEFLLLIDFRLVISSDEMEHYARQLAQYSQRKPGSMPMQFKSVSEPLSAPPMMPSRPMHSMGAFDAFGGNIQNDQVIQHPSIPAPRNATPRRTTLNNLIRTAPHREASEEREQESSVYSETDTDAETDDEPTIKPSHSCGSSDTQSLFSNDASEASFNTNEDDEEENATDDEHKTPERERSHHRRWDSSESTAVDDNRHMASP